MKIEVKQGELSCYWYRADDGSKPPFDYLYIKRDSFYGFLCEPPYEIIEKHDLRLIKFGTFSELCDEYF